MELVIFTVGLNALKKALFDMKCMFTESSSISAAWSVVRQEAFNVNKLAEVGRR
jgi:hypothetical protein